MPELIDLSCLNLGEYILRQGWIVMFVLTVSGFLSMQVSAESVTQVSATNLVSVLDDYYAEVNKQLDKHLNRSRQPFTVQKNAIDLTEVALPTEISKSASVSNFNLDKKKAFSSDHYSNLPQFFFKGFIENKGERAALLEVENLGVFVVMRGDRVGLQKGIGFSSVLNVIDVNELNITLGTGVPGEEIVVQ